MKILVTGAAGFLGRYFLEYLMLQNQHDLWYMDKVRHPDRVQMDVEDMEAWLSDFEEDVDLVIHMAGPVGGRMTIENDPLFNADALRLDSVLFRWAVKHAARVVYPSSSAVYSPTYQMGPHGTALVEQMFSPANPQWSQPDEMYGFTKMAGEVLAHKAARYGLETLVLRPFSGYGPGQSMDYPVPSIVDRAYHHQDPLTIWGDGKQARDFIYVTDLVKWTMALAEQPFKGVRTVNLGNGFPVTFESVARTAADIVGYAPEVVFDDTKPRGVDVRFADTRRMHELLAGAGIAYDPVSLREGLTNMIQALKYESPAYVVKKAAS